jgi:hypothetical protein
VDGATAALNIVGILGCVEDVFALKEARFKVRHSTLWWWFFHDWRE